MEHAKQQRVRTWKDTDERMSAKTVVMLSPERLKNLQRTAKAAGMGTGQYIRMLLEQAGVRHESQ